MSSDLSEGNPSTYEMEKENLWHSPFHLRVPCGTLVDGDLQTMSFGSVGRILVTGIQRQIMASRLAAVNVLQKLAWLGFSKASMKWNTNPLVLAHLV